MAEKSVRTEKSEFDSIEALIPPLDLEQYEPGIQEEVGVEDQVKGSTRYAWIGVGLCGARLVKSFYDLGYKKVLVVDTAHHDLDVLDIPENQKFLMDIGENDFRRDMETGQKAVQEHKQNILNLARQIFGNRVDHIMVSFGAGGGTGSGSVVGLIELAKKYAQYIRLENPSKSVGVVMTLPATGMVSCKVAQNACKIVRQLSQMAMAGKISPLIIIDNDKVNKLCSRMTVKSFWPTINSNFANLFDIFNRLSALSSQYASFDSFDYRSIMQAGGCTIMRFNRVDKFEDPFAISEAVENALGGTLFATGFDLYTAKEAGCVIIGGKELMANVKGLQDNINYAFDVLSEITGKATIHRGIYEDGGNSLRVCTIIGGLDTPTIPLEERGTDLYWGLNTSIFQGPPLHQRKEDILPLAEHFLAKETEFYGEPHKFLSSEAEMLLLNYTWPGNIHELEGTIKRAYVLTVAKEIQPVALPFPIIFTDSRPCSKRVQDILDEARRNIITRTLEFAGGHKFAAAKILRIERPHLNRLIEKLNIPLTNKNIVTPTIK